MEQFLQKHPMVFFVGTVISFIIASFIIAMPIKYATTLITGKTISMFNAFWIVQFTFNVFF